MTSCNEYLTVMTRFLYNLPWWAQLACFIRITIFSLKQSSTLCFFVLVVGWNFRGEISEITGEIYLAGGNGYHWPRTKVAIEV